MPLYFVLLEERNILVDWLTRDQWRCNDTVLSNYPPCACAMTLHDHVFACNHIPV